MDRSAARRTMGCWTPGGGGGGVGGQGIVGMNHQVGTNRQAMKQQGSRQSNSCELTYPMPGSAGHRRQDVPSNTQTSTHVFTTRNYMQSSESHSDARQNNTILLLEVQPLLFSVEC